MSQSSEPEVGLTTVEDIELFIAIYTFLKTTPNSSFQTIADRVGTDLTLDLNPHKLSSFIERLERTVGGAKLIDRRRRSKNNALTPVADAIYERAVDALEKIRSWPGRVHDQIKIAAPHLLLHTVLPKIVPEYRRQLFDKQLRADIRIVEDPDIDSIVEKVSKREISFALIWIHNRNRQYIDYLQKTSFGGIQINETFIDAVFDILMVCPPGHKFVEYAAKEAPTAPNQVAGSSWRLDLRELENELVYTLHPRRQPLYNLIPATNPKLRVEQKTYLDIISRLRCHVHEGIGLVPSVYSELNEMVRKGQLFYAPVNVDDEQRRICIGCITKGEIDDLGASERMFFEIARAKFREISTLVYDPSIMRRPIPESIEDYVKYSYCYFVMQQKATFGVPHWFRGNIDWVVDPEDGQKLKGGFVARTELPYAFTVEGELKKGNTKANRVFHFYGSNVNQRNTISCSFNMAVPTPVPECDAVVGVWSGRGDDGLATIAPMVLSSIRLEIDAVRAIVNRVSFRCLPNAEEGEPNGIASH